MKRRKFIKDASFLLGGLSISSFSSPFFSSCSNQQSFKISLAEWSLHRELFSKKIDHLDFISLAKTEFGIDAVEYVKATHKLGEIEKLFKVPQEIYDSEYGEPGATSLKILRCYIG